MKTIRKDLYPLLVNDIVELLEHARRQSARLVNTVLTATYWEIGHRIIEFEQHGETRAQYGRNVLLKLSDHLTKIFGKGFAVDNLERMRQFYVTYSPEKISATLSRKSDRGKKSATVSRKLDFTDLSRVFHLSWSHYVLLLNLKSEYARNFYEAESLRGGWSVRQLARQIDSQFYERTSLSKNKAAMLVSGNKAKPEDKLTPEEEIKSPYILEFLGLKDEYSETQLEEALIHHLETFLLELGGDFTFVARQKRLRIDDEWYRVDLVFYHRRLRCLVLADLKLGKFTHADAGQMHLYLNYAREHWTHTDENPPVGLILCARKTANVVKYALDNLPNKIMAAEYKTALPDEKVIAAELVRTQRLLECRHEEKRAEKG